MADSYAAGAHTLGAAAWHAIQIPWDAFVAAFLYYTLLTLVAIGVANPPGLFMAAAYLLPVAVYASLVAVRAVQAFAALPIDIGETPHALQH